MGMAPAKWRSGPSSYGGTDLSASTGTDVPSHESWESDQSGRGEGGRASLSPPHPGAYLDLGPQPPLRLVSAASIAASDQVTSV